MLISTLSLFNFFFFILSNLLISLYLYSMGYRFYVLKIEKRKRKFDKQYTRMYCALNFMSIFKKEKNISLSPNLLK